MPAESTFNEQAYIERYPDVRNGFMYQDVNGDWFYQTQKINGHIMQSKKLSNNAFWHWQNFGLGEGRVPGRDLINTTYSNEFNGYAYLARYPDVRLSIDPSWLNNPYQHYLQHGLREGRKPGYEVLTVNSPKGMVTPGTFQEIDKIGVIQQSIPILTENNLGHDQIAIDPLPNPPVMVNSNTSSGNDFTTWIVANPIPVIGIVIIGIMILSKHK